MENTRTDQRKSFYIVGIGASAGGLEALEQFFKNMPGNTGIAFVVIQHLTPNRETIMPELLQRITPMRVQLIQQGQKLVPNYIYLIPPGKSLTLVDGFFRLEDWDDHQRLHLPVDIFFKSLAEVMLDRSIGIILSGMGSDGSLGMAAIKEKKGLAIVQDTASAKFEGMPASASETVMVDIIAPANEIPERLLAHLKFNPDINIKGIEVKATSTKLENVNEKDSKSKGYLEKITRLLYNHSGHDFSHYKKSTLNRRIERRKAIHHLDKIQDYVLFIEENPNELDILFKELLIGVTNFYRDSPLWKELEDRTIPELINCLPDGYKFRVWVPACSSGEEAYSLAIILNEAIEKLKRRIIVQIFATDLDMDAIEKGRRGVFPVNIEENIQPEILQRYFTPEGNGYKINNPIREMIIFAQQNIIKDPPFTKLDILSCRNLLIYMEAGLQHKVMAMFKYSLKPGGILVLGSAETVGAQGAGLEEVNQKLKIYKRSSSPINYNPNDFPSFFTLSRTAISKEKNLPKVVDNIQTLADQILLQRFSPASVLVNANGDILYITGRTGKYLEPAAGKANWNIYAMAREGLRHELPGAFRKAAQSYEQVTIHNIQIQDDHGKQLIDLTLQKLDKPDSIKDLIIVIFSDVSQVQPDLAATPKGKKASLKRQMELELELQRSKEELNVIREEMQTSQEELRSANEELQSMNEELQSANEELTTSKEEMQSLNEELQTVNLELQSKVNDLLQMNDDMKNLLNSTEIATLFLDKDLNIRRFTDLVTNIFKLRNSDVGRPITDLVSPLQYPEMDQHAREVLKSLSPIERAVKTKNEKWYNVRIMPYRTLEDKIDGIVITFTDITTYKQLEVKLKNSNDAIVKAKEQKK